jgi:flavodoxin
MKKVLVTYFSVSGSTEMMAQYIAEGIRISGQQAIVKKISDIKRPDELAGFDGYIFGCPTHFRDVPEPMKTFLRMVRRTDLKGKLGGAFGSYTHDGGAPSLVLETLQYAFDMEPFELGALNLKEAMLEQPPGRGEEPHSRYVAGEVHGEIGEGKRACQDYGRVFGERLGH